jgi:hypothetical protein
MDETIQYTIDHEPEIKSILQIMPILDKLDAKGIFMVLTYLNLKHEIHFDKEGDTNV